MQTIIAELLAVALKNLSADAFKKVIDAALDKVEDAVTSSPNKWDDALVLPLATKIRELLQVEDND